MAAGLGFKTFTTGEVLTAADTNGYLMQGINVFASTAARDAAITSPQEGQFAFTKDTNGLWYYDGAAWVASGATGDIEGVTAGTGISGGGTSGTVTITNSMATEIAAKGDLIVGTGAATFDNLTVGANGTVLTADSTVSPTGLKWATPAVSASGLTKIGSTNTFSNVASVTIDSIFSTTYKTYLVSFDNIYAATGADDLLMQLVYSGTAQTASYYGAVPYGTYDSASFGNIQNNNSSSFTLMQDCSGQYGDALTVWFQQVGNISQEGRFHGTGISRQGLKSHTFGGAVATDRTYTGIKIFSSSTNITGNISVYGLA